MSKLTCVDIENLMGSFTLLEQTISRRIGESSMLEMKLDDVQRTLKFSLVKERSLIQERDGIVATVSTLQETLQQQCDLRDVNESLKDKMAEMKRQNESRLVEKDGEIQKLLDAVIVEEARHQRALETVEQQCQRDTEVVVKQLEAEHAELESLLEAKEAELQGMRDTLKNREKETQNQLLKLRMEVQNSARRSQQQNLQNPTALHHNIFKRKLHFIQEEKNQEIMALRQRVQVLEAQQELKARQVLEAQQELKARQHQQPQQQQHRPGGPPHGPLKRRRM